MLLVSLNLAFLPDVHGFNSFFSDFDECKASNPCSIGSCENLDGNYSCKCPKGYKNNGTNKQSCIKDDPNNLLLIISLGMFHLHVIIFMVIYI